MPQDQPASPPDTATRIREAALALFTVDGFASTSMSTIADSLGVSKAAIYHHFPSKASLLQEIYGSVTDSLWQQLRSIERSELAPPARLRAIIEMQVQYHMREWRFLTVFWRERQRMDTETYTNVRKHERYYQRVVTEAIQDGQSSGVFNPAVDAEMVCTCLLALLSTVYRWERQLNRDADEIAQCIYDLLIKGLEV